MPISVSVCVYIAYISMSIYVNIAYLFTQCCMPSEVCQPRCVLNIDIHMTIFVQKRNCDNLKMAALGRNM